MDESGDPGPRGSTHLILTGAALFEGKWESVRAELAGILIEFWPTPPRPRELHLSELRRGAGLFRAVPAATRLAIEQRLCGVVSGLLESELRVFTVIADKSHWFAQNPGRPGDELYLELFEEVSSRFDLFLRRRSALGSPGKGIIIADPHKDQMSKALRQQQRNALASGNRWSKVHNLIETVFFLDSRESPGLQIADLCSHVVWKVVSVDDRRSAIAIRDSFDREPMSASRNAGKWHGVKYLGTDPLIRERIRAIWT